MNENRLLQNQLQRSKEEVAHLNQKVSELAKEKRQLEDILTKSNRQFDMYSQTVQQELARIKKDSQDLIRKIILQAQENYKAEMV